jgi:transcriptional regulator with XRE-family HTH domain
MAEQLGPRLIEVRKLRQKSLRKVAEGADISASYLQKLEQGQVKNPSPNVLYAISEALDVSYSSLMKAAGYVVPRGQKRHSPEGASVLAHALSSEELTEDEARELAKYLAWYREQQPAKPG